MSSPFAITAATNGVRLDANRRGEAAFTVFNASGRPIRARARLVPDDPVATAWLTLEGESERDLAIAGTEQYAVQIAVPRDAPAGSYPFRLDAVGVENPDEDYTAGPTVTFEVPEPESSKSPFPWWILLIVAGGLIACLLVLCGLMLGSCCVNQGGVSATPTPTPALRISPITPVSFRGDSDRIAFYSDYGQVLKR